jgi:NitT/TauT family transport system substrate-binding protein
MRHPDFLRYTGAIGRRNKLDRPGMLGACRRVAVGALAAIGIAAVLAGSGADAQDAPHVKVTVGETVSLSHLGLYVGMQKGFFQKQGIDIERVVMPGGSKVLGTLVSGDIDIAYLATFAALQAQIRGLPIKIVGVSHDMEIYTLLARTDLKGTINTAADLKGRTIGISTIGSGSWAFANLIAGFAKLDPKNDFSIVPVGNMSALISALKSKSVDAVTLWEPGTSTAMNDGAGYPVVDLLDPVQHKQFLDAPTSLVEVIATREDTIKNKADMMRRFFKAQNESYAWIHSHSVDEIAEVIAPLIGVSDMAVLKQALKRDLPGAPPVATVDEALFTTTIKRLVKDGMLEKSRTFAEAVDNSYGSIK